jgi:hypothetical protein
MARSIGKPRDPTKELAWWQTMAEHTRSESVEGSRTAAEESRRRRYEEAVQEGLRHLFR